MASLGSRRLLSVRTCECSESDCLVHRILFLISASNASHFRFNIWLYLFIHMFRAHVCTCTRYYTLLYVYICTVATLMVFRQVCQRLVCHPKTATCVPLFRWHTSHDQPLAHKSSLEHVRGMISVPVKIKYWITYNTVYSTVSYTYIIELRQKLCRSYSIIYTVFIHTVEVE